jgi:ribosomal subunit interface protein
LNIRISGLQIALGAAFQERVHMRLSEVVSKYFAHAIDAGVAVSRDGDRFKANICVHANTRTMVNAGGEALDIYRAFDEALSRIAKQLRRHKRWLSEHALGNHPAEPPAFRQQ